MSTSINRSCIYLNGTEDYLDAGDSLSLTDAITVEAWVKHDSSGGNGHIVNCGGGWSDKGYSMFWYNDKIRIELQNSSKTTIDNPAPSDDQWHHIAFTWKKSSATITTYIDGEAQSSTGSFSQSLGTPSQYLNIGRNAAHGYYFKGSIAEVRIWNDCRTASEIKEHKNRRLDGDESGLVGYWQLDGTVTDLQINNTAHDLTKHSGTWTVDNTLQIFKDSEDIAICFDGKNDYIYISSIDGLSMGSAVHTIEVWIYPESLPSYRSWPLLLSGEISGAHHWLIKSDGTTQIGVWNGTQASPTINTGKWTHIAASYDGTNLSVYVDGILNSSAAATFNLQSSSIALAKKRGSENYFEGKLRDVRIWNVARSADEIKSNMNNQLQGDEDGLICYWKMDTCTDAITDSSSYGNDAVISGALWSAVSDMPIAEAKVSDAVISFDGTNDYISVNSISGISTGNTSHTIEAWLYLNSLPSNRSWPLLFGGTGSGNHHWLIKSDGTTQIGVWSGIQGDPTLSINKWTHIASAYDGTTLHVYVDGSLYYSGAAAFNLKSSSLLLAQAQSSENFFDGKMANVRIWNNCRTADQIKENIYRRSLGSESGLAGYFPLNKGYSSFTQNYVTGDAAAISGATWVSDTSFVLFEPDDNICLKLDGSSDQYVAIDNLTYSAAGEISEITVEAWVKTDSDSQEIVASWDRSEYWRLAVGNDAGGDQQRVYWATKASSGIDDMIGNTIVADGDWHHIAASYQSGTGAKKIYVDGVLDKEITAHSGKALGSGTLRYGFIGSGSEANSFNGSRSPKGCDACIDEVRIWHKVRSQSEIKANMKSRLWGDEDGLVGCWTFETVSSDGTVEDSSGNGNNGTLMSGAYAADNDISFTSPSPKTNAVLNFNGISNYIYCGDFMPTSSYTKEAWIKPSTVDEQAKNIISGTSGTHALYITSGGYLSGGHNGAWGTVADPNICETDTWIHVAITYDIDTETMVLYKNGEPIDTATGVVAPNFTDLRVNIGKHNTGNLFQGKIADVRIWNTARTADQIKTYMNNRLWGSEDNLAAYYKLNSGEYGQTTAADSTGNYDADISGASWYSDSDLSLGDPIATENPVLSFNGTSDYVELENGITLGSSFTQEAWIYPTMDDTAYHGFLGYQPVSTAQRAPSLWVKSKTKIHAGFGDGSNWKSFITGDVLTLNAWNHVAATYDGTDYIIYVNGEQVHTASISATPYSTPVKHIGKVDNYFEGMIADVRIWDKVRTAEEIKSCKDCRLWGTEQGLTGYWKLNEEGGTAKDSAGTSNYNETTGDWETSGNDGTIIGPVMTASDLNLSDATSDSGSATSDQIDISSSETIGDSVAAPDISDQDISADTSQSGWLADMFSGYTLPSWLNTLIGEIENCFDGGSGKLTIGTDSFSEFSLFTLIDDLEVANIELLEIDNVLFSLIGLGVDANKGVFDTYDVALSVTGNVSFLGLVNVDVELRFYTGTDGKKIGVVMISSSGSMSVSDLLGGNFGELLDILGDISIADPAIGFTTSSLDQSCFSDDQYPFELGINKGLNFYGTLDFSNFGCSSNPSDVEKVISFLVGLLGLDSIRVWASITKNTGSLNMTLYLVLDADLTIIKGSGFEIKYHSCKIKLSLEGSPPEPSVSVTNTLSLTLDYIGADELLLSGTIKGETESITCAYTLQQSSGRESVWHPFNYSGISVESLAIQFGATYLAPWVDNFGIAANSVTVGDVEGSLAILIDTNDPDQFVFYLAVNKISLMDIITVMCPLVNLSSDVKDVLSELLDVSITDLELKIIPAACYIGEILYDDTGVTVAGDMDAWGWNAIVDMNVTTGAVDLYAEMDELSVKISDVTLLSISGYGGNDNPLMKFYLGTDIDSLNFYISGSVTFFGVTQQLYISASSSGLNFLMDYSSKCLDTSLSVTFGKTSGNYVIAMAGYVEFNLNITVSTTWGDIKLSDISLTAYLAMSADTSPSFSLSTYGSFDFWGSTLKIGSSSNPVTLSFSVPPSSISAITCKIEDYITDNAEDIFSDIWGSLTEWANAVADGVIWFGDSVADVAKDVYGEAADAAATAYKAVGEGAETVAKGLSETYNSTEKAVASAMKSAGYAAEEVASGLSSAYNATEEAVASALKSAGYAADEVASALSSAYNTSAEAVASVLKDVGYAVDDVGDALEDVYGLGAEAIGDVLDSVGYAGQEIQDFLGDVFDFYWDWTPYVDVSVW